MILCSLPLTVFGESACPKGLTECDAPCGMCVDKDNDGICDYIQSNPQIKDIVNKVESRKQISENNKRKKNIPAQTSQNIKPPIAPKKTVKTTKKAAIKKTSGKKPYHLFPISAFLLLLYLIGIILYKKKIIEAKTHFKFWNFALLLTFLISGLLGILLVIMINYGIRIKLPFNIMLWHTEAGIAMFMISLFHIHWHWQYIKNIFKIQK